MPDMPEREAFEQQLTEEITKVLQQTQANYVDSVWREGFTQGDITEMPEEVESTWRKRLMMVLQALLVAAFIKVAQNFANLVQFGTPDDIEAQAQAWANRALPLAIDEMTQTNNNALQRLGQRNQTDSLSKQALRALLMTTGLFGAARAIRIALDQTTKVTTAGELPIQQALQTSGASVDARWFTREDERVCVVCRPLHGQPIELVGFRPPAHVQCRCYEGYVITKDDETTVLFDDEAVARTF